MTSSPQLRELADKYWEARLESSPLFATIIGDHRYDDRVEDLSAAAEQALRATWTALISEVEAIDPASLDETDIVTRDLLLGELRDNIVGIESRLIELRSDQMQGVHARSSGCGPALKIGSATASPSRASTTWCSVPRRLAYRCSPVGLKAGFRGTQHSPMSLSAYSAQLPTGSIPAQSAKSGHSAYGSTSALV